MLVCPDSFKGSLTAAEAARAMARGIRQAFPGAVITELPLADGGDGTLAVLRSARRGRLRRVRVPGPDGRPVTASVLLLPNRTAVVEMAQAAGLLLIPAHRRDAPGATTAGVGRMIAAAVRAGARRIIVTLGGSATTDGGAGMARALGARFLDAFGREIPPGGLGLRHLDRIDARALRRYRSVRITGATDVRNPLTGPAGAASVFAPQKGATPPQVKVLAAGLDRLAAVIRRDLGTDVRRLPRGGAAGGLGAGLHAFLGADLVSGADLVFDLVDLDRNIRNADLILTGEGSLDAQTPHGKLVMRVAARARRRRVPVLAFAGRVRLGRTGIRNLGLAGAFPIAPRGTPLRTSIRRAGPLLTSSVAAVLASHRPAGL